MKIIEIVRTPKRNVALIKCFSCGTDIAHPTNIELVECHKCGKKENISVLKDKYEGVIP